ncbi:MAG: hypothetical protein ABI295_10230 [Xanthomarina sp.]
MNKTIKAVGLATLGLIIWSALAYMALAFLKAELNPFVWSQGARGAMLFIIFSYGCFSPLIVMSLKNEM